MRETLRSKRTSKLIEDLLARAKDSTTVTQIRFTPLWTILKKHFARGSADYLKTRKMEHYFYMKSKSVQDDKFLKTFESNAQLVFNLMQPDISSINKLIKEKKLNLYESNFLIDRAIRK